jgi:outer membrane protein OmpA-like peptidoglycan-associated protein
MKNLISRSQYHRRRIALLVSGLLGLTILSHTAQAQVIPGTLAFGFDGGADKYYGNYTGDLFSFQGDAFVRWNILDWLSLHAAYNGGVLHYKSTPQSIANEYLLPGTGVNSGNTGTDGSPVGSTNQTRVGGWDLMVSANVFPSQTFVPYFIGGLEALNFQPDDGSPAPLRNNTINAYSKNVIGGVLGVGFEYYITPKVMFVGKGLIHLTGTDWLDDYSNPADYSQDAYLSFGLGFSVNLFTPEEPAPVPVPPSSSTTTIENNHTYITNDTTVKTVYHVDTIFMTHVDTVVVTERANTMYMNPAVNTVFYFPGTLFIVNTDQLNNAEPNNMKHLYAIKGLIEQCPNLRVEIQGYASGEGNAAHNQDLSERRANRIREWLLGQGVDPNRITRTIGYGDTRPAVRERTDVSASELEAERVQNRRVAVMVVQACQ